MMDHVPRGRDCSCEVVHEGTCIDALGSNCEGDFDLLECEEALYASLDYNFPPKRCRNCRHERRELTDEEPVCITCGRRFYVRAMQRKWAKTNAPEGFDLRTYLPVECGRCRGLTDEERKMMKQLLELEQQGHLTLTRAFRFVKTRNQDLRQKILDGRLRPVDLTRYVIRKTADGRELRVERFRGYTKTFDASGRMVLYSVRQGGRMIHYDANFKRVAETRYQPPSTLEQLIGMREGRYVTQNSAGRETSTTKWREPGFIDSLLGVPGAYVTKRSDTGLETETRERRPTLFEFTQKPWHFD